MLNKIGYGKRYETFQSYNLLSFHTMREKWNMLLQTLTASLQTLSRFEDMDIL